MYDILLNIKKKLYCIFLYIGMIMYIAGCDTYILQESKSFIAL